MKVTTVLKTIGWFVGWVLSFHLISVTVYLMNQPSNISFTFGVLTSVATFGTIFYFAWNTGVHIARLLREYGE